jgi:predicted nucleic acid-binding protein
MGLLNDLGRGPVALDSSIFIYFIEEHPRFLPVVKPVFSSVALLRRAAHLRASSGLKTPDALQLAAALESGCSVFLTNDERIPQVAGLRVLQAQDYLEPG